MSTLASVFFLTRSDGFEGVVEGVLFWVEI